MALVPLRATVPLPVIPEGTVRDFSPLPESDKVRLMVTFPFVQPEGEREGDIVGLVVSCTMMVAEDSRYPLSVLPSDAFTRIFTDVTLEPIV